MKLKPGDLVGVCEHFDGTLQEFFYSEKPQLIGPDIMTMVWTHWVSICPECRMLYPCVDDAIVRIATIVEVNGVTENNS